MDQILNKLAEVSKTTPENVKKLTEDPILAKLYKASGNNPAVLNGPGGYKGTLSPLEISASTIDLTNTYTDPIESYMSYGVPLNPFVDWNEERAKRQSTLEKWGHGLTKAGITGLTAVAENTLGTVAGLINLAFGENHSFYDNPVGRAMDDINEWAREAMPNYYTKAEQRSSVVGDGWGTGLLSANFWADKVAGGAAYTMGSIASMFLGTGEAALIGRLGNMGRASKFAKVLDVAADTEKALEKGSRTLNNYRTAKIITGKVGKSADEVAKGTERLAKMANINTGAKQLTVATQMSLAEANMEARETKNRFIEEQTAKWEEANPGQEMPEDIRKGIEESAYAAGNMAFGLNMAVLAPTNILMFGKMFKGGKPLGEALINKVEKQGTGLGAKWIESQGATKFSKVLNKSNRIFGKPVQNMLTESFQEGAQFLSSEASRIYYDDKFADGTGDLAGAFSQGLSKTFGSKEGIENMLIGAIIGGGTGTISRLAGADKKLQATKDANTKKALDILNSGSFAKVLENMENNDINKRIVNEMDKAVKAGDMITADRYRMRLISNVADQYRKIGALDAAVEQLEDLKELDEKEFISRWGYDTTKTLKEQTGKTQIEIIDEVKNKIETYSKVRENIDTILRAQQPEKAIIPRVVDALFDTDAIKKSKALETSVRAMYGNMLLNRVVDLDSIDDNIDKIYDELVQLSPALGKLSKEDFSFQVKVGDIKLDEEGKFVLSPSNKAVTTSKATEEFLKVANAYKEINRPDIANEIQYKMASLNALIKDREVARTSYERFIAKPGELADSIIADILDAPRKAREQANATGTQALQNAQSTDELATAFPDNTDDDLKLQAMARMDELEALETPIYNSYMDMSDEEFAGIKIDDLQPLEEAAYKRAVRTRAEKAAELRQSKNIEFQSPEADQAAEAALVSYQDVLSDMEARTFGEIMVSYDGGSVNIDGRTYHNLEDNPLDAIIRNEKGDIIGFILTDLSTGNKITWNKTEVQIDPQTGQVSPEYERADRDNAIVDGLSYMTLLQAASIRPDQTIPAADAKEELAPRIQAITEEFEKKEAFENNQGATEAERELANKGLDKNEGLTDIQLRAQIETLKEDLAELNEVIYINKMIAVEAGLTMQEFYNDSEVKSLTQKRKKVTERILRKINVLRARKQQVRNEVIPNSTNEAELAVPTEDESNFIAAGLNEEIKKLQDELSPLEEEAKGYRDIINGKYGENQDVEGAKAALQAVNKKIGVIKSKITKRNNQINRINEERELEKLRQERDAAEGTGTAPQGEEPQGKDIDSREGVEETRVDGILDDKEAERLREQAEEAAKKFKEEQERQKNAPADTSTPSVVTTQVKPTPVIKEEGAVKVQLTKGEVGTNPEFKVLVSTEGLSMSNDLVAQFVDGKPIVTQPGQLTKPEVAAPGTMVRFEVAENTDWWQMQTPTPGEEWKTVPIYVIATDAAGNEIRVGMLQANGESREDIYSLYKQGFTPVAMVERKLFDGTNVRNSRVQTPTGEQTFFYPASTLGNAGEAPQIVYVGAEYGNRFSKTWKMMNSPSGAVDPETHFPLQNQENITHGQVGIVVRRPDGSYGVVMASTRDMTEEGRQAAISTVTAETPDLVAFSNIVGVNKLTNEAEVADNAESDVVSLLDDDSVGELGQFRESFMLVESLLTGAQLITFYSESSKQLVRMNANELKATLLGAIGRFSFVEATTDEDGKTRMKVVSKENKDEYKAVAANLKADFEKIIMKKKFQVSKERLTNDTSPFVSPINGVTYPSYFAFLTSEDALGTPREGSVGSNAILAVDVSKNEHGHVFYDVGLSLNNLGTIEGDATTQRELDANSIPFPKPTAAPTTPAPSATGTPTPTTDAKADVKLSPTDKIIWGHPGLGKTTFKEQNPDKVLDFDTDFKPKVAELLGLPKNKQNSKGLNEWRNDSNKTEFETAMKQVWKEAVAEAKKTGKMLVVSDMIFLKENAKDFDKIITLDKETFIKRTTERGDDVTNLESWKSNIDKIIASVNQNKVISTNKYFAELAALGQSAPQAPAMPQAPAAPVSESEILEVPSGPMEGSGIFAFMQPTAQPVVVPSSPLDEGAKQGSITDLGDFMSRFKVPEGFNPGVSVNDIAPNVQDAIGEEINKKCKGE